MAVSRLAAQAAIVGAVGSLIAWAAGWRPPAAPHSGRLILAPPAVPVARADAGREPEAQPPPIGRTWRSAGGLRWVVLAVDSPPEPLPQPPPPPAWLWAHPIPPPGGVEPSPPVARGNGAGNHAPLDGDRTLPASYDAPYRRTRPPASR